MLRLCPSSLSMSWISQAMFGHGCQFSPWELVVLVHRDARYHSVSSLCSRRRSLRLSTSCSQRSCAAAALSRALIGAVVLCPRELTSSFGFWYSGILKSDKGVCSGDALASSPERVDVALPSNVLFMSAKNTLLVEDGCGTGKGSFFFITVDRLKVGVW